MIIGLGADHAGCGLKDALSEHLSGAGHQVQDFGTRDPSVSVDYPVFARLVADAVSSGSVEAGILVCGTGIGMSIAANKLPGIRAALVHDATTARLAREHNDANILVVAGRLMAPPFAMEIVDTYLNATFEPRHQRRLDLIADMEQPDR